MGLIRQTNSVRPDKVSLKGERSEAPQGECSALNPAR
jgi:hypothetical protein